MNNPYQVLGLHQDATKEEIHKAFIKAQMENVKSKKFSGKEIMEAQKQLMNPEKRLVADFLFPSKLKSKRLKLIEDNLLIPKEFAEFKLDADRLDSLKHMDYYD